MDSCKICYWAFNFPKGKPTKKDETYCCKKKKFLDGLALCGEFLRAEGKDAELLKELKLHNCKEE